MLRATVGFLIAPIVGVAVSTLVLLRGDIYEGWWIFLVSGTIAYLSAFLFGLPAYLVMRRTTVLKWWQIGAVGGLCGLPYWLVSEYPYTGAYFKNHGFENLVLYVG